MKFRCERDVLADALTTAGRAATSRTGALPVLEGLHLGLVGDELSVTGTDLDMSIRLAVTVGGASDGAVVVPARLSADAVKSLPSGAVEVSAGDDEVSITAGRSQFSLRNYNVDDYPAQVDPAAEAVTLSSADFADALRQVVRAASTDEARGRHHRRLDRRRGGLRAHGRHGLVPAGGARPARPWDPRQRAACPRPTPGTRRVAAHPVRRRAADGSPGDAPRHLRVRSCPSDDAAHRGRLSELPQPRAGDERQRPHGRQGGAARVVAPRPHHGPARYLVGGAPASRWRHADPVGA